MQKIEEECSASSEPNELCLSLAASGSTVSRLKLHRTKKGICKCYWVRPGLLLTKQTHSQEKKICL